VTHQPIPVLLVLVALTPAAALAQERIVGLPCEGCEAVFQGLPSSLGPAARIAPATEPGEPLTLTGRVVGPDGAPRAGVVVYAYQTDATGVYPRPARSTGAAADRHGRLRGWAVSGPDGRYTFETIRPGAYPGRDTPAHIHMHVIERGCSTYYLDDVMFTDDPLLTPARSAALSNGRGGSGVVTPVTRDGRWHVTRDIRLGLGVPGYAACPAPRR
jgi:protocatechuate 3,4-dioxygenase beta subunit